MKYYGPSTKFESTPTFGRAAAICELEDIPCRLDPYENTIHFASIKAEEQFTIALRRRFKAAAGLSSSATRPTEGRSQQ